MDPQLGPDDSAARRFDFLQALIPFRTGSSDDSPVRDFTIYSRAASRLRGHSAVIKMPRTPPSLTLTHFATFALKCEYVETHLNPEEEQPHNSIVRRANAISIELVCIKTWLS